MTYEGDKNNIYRRIIQVLSWKYFYYLNAQVSLFVFIPLLIQLLLGLVKACRKFSKTSCKKRPLWSPWRHIFRYVHFKLKRTMSDYEKVWRFLKIMFSLVVGRKLFLKELAVMSQISKCQYLKIPLFKISEIFS